jgi:transposase
LYQGTANTEFIIFWFKEILLPDLEPNSTIILDNAAIHKSLKLKILVESFGHKLLFLSAYSPDLNPIEHKWQELKHNIGKYYKSCSNYIDYICKEILKLTKCEVC